MAKAKLEKAPAKAARAHIRYKDSTGKVVPGVTTILGIMNKPALVKWANNLGLQGIDSAKYVDETARIGTLAHEMIQEHLGGARVEYEQYTKAQIDSAENAILSFFEWEKQQKGAKMDTAAIELPLVSEIWRYGGTIDWYGKIGDKYWLIDIKTAKGLFIEHELQVSAYYQMLTEHGYKVDGVRLLRVGRTEDEGFDDHILDKPQLDMAWAVFQSCLTLYRAKQDYERKCKGKAAA